MVMEITDLLFKSQLKRAVEEEGFHCMPVLAPQTPPPYEEKLDRICKPADLDSGARSGRSGARGMG